MDESKTICIDATELGPRNVAPGERMTADYGGGYAVLCEYDGRQWVKIATCRRSDYPNTWTWADGSRHSDAPPEKRRPR